MKISLCSFLAVVSFVAINVASKCTPGDFSAHPTSCDRYLICDNGEFVEMPCAPGTVFNKDINVCDWPSNVTSCDEYETTVQEGIETTVQEEYETTVQEGTEATAQDEHETTVQKGNDTTDPEQELTSTPAPSPSNCKCELELSPLYHIVVPWEDYHAYTPSMEEAERNMPSGVEYAESPGLVALNALDCNCRATLQYPTRLYREPTTENPIRDIFFSLDSGEIGQLINGLGHRWEGLPQYHFYCSTTAGSCGATVPLHRYFKNGKHYYYTTIQEEDAQYYKGITCYIWPYPDAE